MRGLSRFTAAAAAAPGCLTRVVVAPTRRCASTLNDRINAAAMQVTRTSAPKAKTPNEKLVFGASMSDHMLEVDWDHQAGWGAPRIVPYHALALDPAASVLHYGIEAFEGMKAYRDDDGGIRLFRPDLNMARLRNSMERLAGPPLDGAGFTECLAELVRQDADWIPRGDGFSLYLRPTFISTWPYLGVTAGKSFKLYVITCPVGPYYPEGFKPVKLLASSHDVRAWPGGVGNAKVGGNYAPSIKVQREAAERGYSQVLWLFGDDREVTEVGTMNFFVHWVNEDGVRELVTAPLTDGTILPGVTRQSILDLARAPAWAQDVGLVLERKFTMAQLAKAVAEGRMLEAFGAGTAAVVSPVKGIHWEGVDYEIPLNKAQPSAGAGPLAQRVWDCLRDIQYGRSPHPWSVKIA